MPNQSPIEKSFWETAKPLIPELEQEIWIDKYRVDFLIPNKKIIIELYGYEYHNSKQKITKDAERERHLQGLGYQVIRFTGSEIFKDVKKCVNEILKLAKIEPQKDNTNTRTIELKHQNQIYTNKKTSPSKMNNLQIGIIAVMTITALCSGCLTLSTIMNITGR